MSSFIIPALLVFFMLAMFAPLPARASGGGGDSGGHGGGQSTKKEGGFLSSGPMFVSMGPLIFPVLTSDGPQQIMTMLLSIQVKNLDDSDKLREKMPVFTDAIMRHLYGKFDETNTKDGVAVDMDFVKNRMIKAGESVYGKGLIQDILIQGVSQRPIRNPE